MLSQLAGTLQCASFGILGNMFHSCSLSRAFHNFWVIPHFDPIGKKKKKNIFFVLLIPNRFDKLCKKLEVKRLKTLRVLLICIFSLRIIYRISELGVRVF